MVRTPLKTTKTLGEFDVLVNVKGGGLAGQAGAISLGIARPLSKSINPCRKVCVAEVF